MMPGSLALLFASPETGPTPGELRLWVRIAAFAVILVGMAIGALILNRVSRRIRKVGATLGWAYSRKGTLLSAPGMTGFPFGGLRSGEFVDELSGVWRERPAKILVLKDVATEYSTKFQLTMLWMPAPMPPIEFHPRSNLQRKFDIESEVKTDSAEFNKRWRVICGSSRYARAVTTPQLMERLLSERSAEIPITIDGQSIFTWVPVQRAASVNIQASLSLLADVVNLIPFQLGQFGGWEKDSNTGVVHKAKRHKGYLAVLSVILPITLLFAPVGILAGHLSLRACRRGEATNHRWAVIGLAFSYAATATIAGLVVSARLIS